MPSTLSLRRASINDFEILLEWRNDPLTRTASHNVGEVPREKHEQWLKATLKNPNRQLYIAEENGVPVGTVRADFFNGAYELSWTVSPQARGCGKGKQMVALLANQINGPIKAKIKVGNVASVQIAQNSGMELEYQKDGVMYFGRPQNYR